MVTSVAVDAPELSLAIEGSPAAREWTSSGLHDAIVVEDEPSGAIVRQMITALDNVQEAIVMLSSERRVQYRNRAAQALFDDAAEVALPEGAWAKLERGHTWRGTLTMARHGDERRMRFYAKPLLGLHGERSHLVVVHDVTDVQRLQSIADAVSFSDNLGHFLSGIRHELGNPVNSIKTALTVLRTNLDGFPREKVADYLDRVLGEVGRIEFLLRWLRCCSVDEVIELGHVSLAEIVRTLTRLVGPSAQRAGVTLLVEPPPDLVVVADVRALHQVLLNLVSNAIEALSGVASPLLRIEAAPVGHDHVEICVVDNGHGMSPEALAAAMRPFFTTKPTGTGLGLVIAQRLLAPQGARLRLHSTVGVGTRAVVTLARAADVEVSV
jgi:signal transduction histidine kinase